MYDTDVLVVGAGPSGLTVAASLVNRGIATTVVDNQSAGSNTSKAAVVNARTLEVLEDLDVARRLVKEGIQAPRFTIRDGHRTLIPVDFSPLPTAYPYSLMVPQSTTERLLLDRLTELGGSVIRPKTLQAIEQDPDGVTAVFDDGDVIRARYAVGADGIRSTVREHAGIGFQGGAYDESFILADVRLAGEAPVDEVILFWAKAGLTVVAPLPGGVHRIVAPVSDAPEEPTAAVRPTAPRRTRARDGADGRHRGHLGLALPDPPSRCRHVPGGTAAAGRRRCARAQPGRRAGHEPRYPGCGRAGRRLGSCAGRRTRLSAR